MASASITALRMRVSTVLPGLSASREGRRVGAWNHDRVPIRLLIVDDNRSFLEAAGALLEREGLTVAGVASAGDEAIRQAMAAGVAWPVLRSTTGPNKTCREYRWATATPEPS
jgi:hypothetical protein